MALYTFVGLLVGAFVGWGLALALFDGWASRLLLVCTFGLACGVLASPGMAIVQTAALDDLLIWGVAALAGSIGLLAVVNVLDMVFEADAEAG